VAPLKLVRRVESTSGVLCIHGSQAVAPLKHCKAWAATLPRGGIHGSQAVAPLKRRHNAPTMSSRATYPRLPSRGPIEAGLPAFQRRAPSRVSTAPKPWPH